MALTVFDLNQFLLTSELTTSATIAQAITKLQEGKTFNCPKCGGTGDYDGDGPSTICDVCNGYGKTVQEYEAYEAVTGYRIVEP